MTTRKLGRGLDALLGNRDPGSVSALMTQQPPPQAPDGSLRDIPVDLIQPGEFQPRRDMKAQTLEELAQSIAEQGVMQPVVVRELGNGRFELIAGERRWRACQLSKRHSIPAIVKKAADRDAISMALIENIQREDLSPMELANALQRLQREFGMTQQQVAEAVGKSRESVANLLRLLGLEAEVRQLLEERRIEMGHARALLGAAGAEQARLAREVVGKGLNVRQTEELVRRQPADSGRDRKPGENRDPDLLRLEENLSQRLGARVAIRHTARGKGKLIINYNNPAELEGILAHINEEPAPQEFMKEKIRYRRTPG